MFLIAGNMQPGDTFYMGQWVRMITLHGPETHYERTSLYAERHGTYENFTKKGIWDASTGFLLQDEYYDGDLQETDLVVIKQTNAWGTEASSTSTSPPITSSPEEPSSKTTTFDLPAEVLYAMAVIIVAAIVAGIALLLRRARAKKPPRSLRLRN